MNDEWKPFHNEVPRAVFTLRKQLRTLLDGVHCIPRRALEFRSQA